MHLVGYYSNLYYPTRWATLKRKGLGWQRCNRLYGRCRCVASCGLLEGNTLEIVLDVRGCNMNCRPCWGWKMRHTEGIKKTPEEVLRDVLCRVEKVMNDRILRRTKYKLGALRITGNEPALQWPHLMAVLRIIDDENKLRNCAEIDRRRRQQRF